MIHAQNHRVVAEVPAAAIGSTATAQLVIDTIGYDHASVTILRASNASTVFAGAVKVEESDNNSSYSDVTALVGGGTGASANVAIVARRGRGVVSPETAAQAGCIGVVRG